MATSKDVAKLAGVSHTTVSRAFRGNAKMKKETYDRVMEAARQLHYEPNTVAADLRSRKTNTVGIVINSAEVTFFMNVVQELETQLQEKGFRLLISFDGHDPERQFSAFRAMAGARAGAIIYIPLERSQKEEQRLGRWMKSSGIHFIQIFGTHTEENSSVLIDDIGGALLGMRYLLEKGHRRVLMVGGRERAEGFERAYAERGIEPPVPQLNLPGDDAALCRAAIKRAVKETEPTAVFSISDRTSVITYSVLAELRCRVPQDVSLLVFDDSFWSQSLNISVIGQPIAEIAGSIANQVMKNTEVQAEGGMFTVSKTVFTPFLVDRATILPVNQNIKE